MTEHPTGNLQMGTLLLDRQAPVNQPIFDNASQIAARPTSMDFIQDRPYDVSDHRYVAHEVNGTLTDLDDKELVSLAGAMLASKIETFKTHADDAQQVSDMEEALALLNSTEATDSLSVLGVIEAATDDLKDPAHPNDKAAQRQIKVGTIAADQLKFARGLLSEGFRNAMESPAYNVNPVGVSIGGLNGVIRDHNKRVTRLRKISS